MAQARLARKASPGDAVDIADWLRRLGLAQYEQLFRDHAIDLEIVPELTEADLEKLGVLLGDRKRILRAIAALGATEPPPFAETAPPRAKGAERRQLTVMFCDLVGSTALAARFDLEDLREIIAVYHRAVAKIVAGFDGLVATYGSRSKMIMSRRGCLSCAAV